MNFFRELKAAKDEATKSKTLYKKKYLDADNELKESQKREQLLYAGNKALKVDLEKRDNRIKELETEVNIVRQEKTAAEIEKQRLIVELQDEKDTVDDVRKRSVQFQMDLEARSDRIAGSSCVLPE